MYLKDGREIYECDKFPGYYIDANTGNFCDEQGNYIGGNIDNGDEPGSHAMMIDVPDIVYVSKTGKQYYPKPNKVANIPMDLEKAHQKGLTPSAGYTRFAEKLYKQQLRKLSKSHKK